MGVRGAMKLKSLVFEITKPGFIFGKSNVWNGRQYFAKSIPCCYIKFGAQIHQTFGYQGTTLKSMSSAGLIKW
jgi:hypothetical protein